MSEREHETLVSLFTDCANAIREKDGSSGLIIADTFPSRIRSIRTGFFGVARVEYPVGSICTCTQGSVVLVASDTSGNYDFEVPTNGTWTIKITNGTKEKSTTVNINTKYQVIDLSISYELPAPPNDQYESKSLGTWSSLSQVDSFLTTYNADNGYRGLKLGNYVTIQDGTYNTQWEIAGFNMENGHIASDGRKCENGPGICMIPKTAVTTAKWNTTMTLSGGYISSNIHTSTLPTVSTKLKNVLGNHLILRNVLLSNATNGTSPRNSTSSSYTWTTSYATLMSIGQMNGTFKANNNLYDDGEANYKLPLFNYENYKTGSSFWSRGVYGSDTSGCYAWDVYSGGYVNYSSVTNSIGVRPLIYIR